VGLREKATQNNMSAAKSGKNHLGTWQISQFNVANCGFC
jgi:hypothetical protein